MRLEAHGDRVIVKVIKDAEVSDGGVYIPEGARERSQRGRVISVGPGRYEMGQLVPLWFNVGDVVLFSKYGGTELNDDNELLVLREADVLAIERREENDAEMADPYSGADDVPELALDATFHIDQLNEHVLTQAAAQLRATSERPPTIVVGSRRAELTAKRIVASVGHNGNDMGPLYGLFDVRLADEGSAVGADEWRLEPAAAAE
jgi:chaperonin GroES